MNSLYVNSTYRQPFYYGNDEHLLTVVGTPIFDEEFNICKLEHGSRNLFYS